METIDETTTASDGVVPVVASMVRGTSSYNISFGIDESIGIVNFVVAVVVNDDEEYEEYDEQSYICFGRTARTTTIQQQQQQDEE